MGSWGSKFLAGFAVTVTVLSGIAWAAPAQAIPVSPVTIIKERTGANPIVAGSSSGTEFTITVTNNVDGPISPVFVDYADPGLQITSFSSAEFTCSELSPNQLSCQGPLQSGASGTVKVTMTAAAWVRPATLTNCAAVGLVAILDNSADASVNNGVVPCGVAVQPVGPNVTIPNVAEATVDVINDADLALTAKHASQYDQVDPGRDAVADFAVTNNGPSDATGPITVKGTLPAGLTFVSGTAPWTCAAVGQEVGCTWMPEPVMTTRVQPNVPLPAGTLPVGASAPPLSWTVTTAKPGIVSSYPVSVTAASATDDSKPANNTASTPIGVTPVDVAIAKSASGAFRIDDQGVWKLSVSNVGTIDDAGVMTLVDTLPAGSSLVSAGGTGWDCKAVGFTVTCTHAGLAKGAVSELTLTTDVKSGFPQVTNNATVTSSSYEKETGNNSASADVKVRRVAQTAAALPASPTRVKSGKTEQGQRLNTRVFCRPVRTATAGDVSFCRVRKSGGVVRVTVIGSRPVKVTVIQTAKGTKKYRPFVQRKTYLVKP